MGEPARSRSRLAESQIDTGARTSSLHAFDIVEFEQDAQPWVRFKVKPWQDSQEDAVVVECPVHDRRAVRSSSGHAQEASWWSC